MTPVESVKARLTALRSDEMARSGYALLLSSVVTSLLGIAYWFIVPRLFDSREVGRATALVSAMLLVTSLGTAGLKRGLIRFVPVAGPGVARLVTRTVLAGLAATLLGALILVSGNWLRNIGVLHDGLAGGALFVGAALVWGAYTLQDPVLIGAGRSGTVLVKNAAHSVGKIVALVAIAAVAGGEISVLASWALPALVAVVVVTRMLYGRRFPEMAAERAAEDISVGGVMRFAGGEYVAALAWLGAVYVTPLIVIDRAGAIANAHFYMAFQVGYGLYLVSSNITDAFVAHASATPERIWEHARSVSRQLGLLMVPAVAVALIGAPWIMRLFGAEYASATSALRLLALSSVPNTVTTVLVAVAHARRRVWIVVVTQVVMAAATVGLEVSFVSRGIGRVALAWLLAQSAAAVVAIVLTVSSSSRRAAA